MNVVFIQTAAVIGKAADYSDVAENAVLQRMVKELGESPCCEPERDEGHLPPVSCGPQESVRKSPQPEQEHKIKARIRTGGHYRHVLAGNVVPSARFSSLHLLSPPSPVTSYEP